MKIENFLPTILSLAIVFTALNEKYEAKELLIDTQQQEILYLESYDEARTVASSTDSFMKITMS